MRKQQGPVRWKPRMIVPPQLRAVRTTLLGHMPGWCPPVHAVGPWRPVELLDPASADILHGVRADLWARVQDQDGVVSVRMHFPASAPASGAFEISDDAGCRHLGSLSRVDRHTLEGAVRIERPRLWWPHTHGEPNLYRVDAVIEARTVYCGRVGFRSVSVDRTGDTGSLALRINGEKLFCRGACISSMDLPGLADTDEASRRWLELARAGGMNMVRVSGVTCYPGEAFYRICDELGLLVWQDFMFANFDYGSIGPGVGLTDDIRREVGEWLASTRTHPCVAVVCGASEAEQQAAMLGAARSEWKQPLFDALIPELVAVHRPDIAYVSNSPTGEHGRSSPIPASATTTAWVRTSVRCPTPDLPRSGSHRNAWLSPMFLVTGRSRTWARLPCTRRAGKRRVPRDAGASWDFEDVREHYLRTVYDVDPPRLRYEQPERYLDAFARRGRGGDERRLRRMATRRGRVATVVWSGNSRILLPGAGWGIVDALGRPKSAWHALRQVWQPLQVLMTDEGLNGLQLHVINETAQPRALLLELRCLRDGEVAVAQARQPILLRAHSARVRGGGRAARSLF
ncbi:hypothetical protein ACTMU2_37325 [Cupriavidus basilensis]